MNGSEGSILGGFVKGVVLGKLHLSLSSFGLGFKGFRGSKLG